LPKKGNIFFYNAKKNAVYSIKSALSGVFKKNKGIKTCSNDPFAGWKKSDSGFQR